MKILQISKNSLKIHQKSHKIHEKYQEYRRIHWIFEKGQLGPKSELGLSQAVGLKSIAWPLMTILIFLRTQRCHWL